MKREAAETGGLTTLLESILSLYCALYKVDAGSLKMWATAMMKCNKHGTNFQLRNNETV